MSAVLSGLELTSIHIDLSGPDRVMVQALIDGRRKQVFADDNSEGDYKTFHAAVTPEELTAKYCEMTGKTPEEAAVDTDNLTSAALEVMRDKVVIELGIPPE